MSSKTVFFVGCFFFSWPCLSAPQKNELRSFIAPNTSLSVPRMISGMLPRCWGLLTFPFARPDLKLLKTLVKGQNDVELGFTADQAFLTGLSPLRLDKKGRSLALVDTNLTPYPVKIRSIQTYLLASTLSSKQLRRAFSPQHFHVLDQVRSYLLEHPDKKQDLQEALARPSFLSKSGEQYVVFGPFLVRALDKQRDLKKEPPASRIYRLPNNGFELFYEFRQGDGDAERPERSMLEGKPVRAIVFSEGEEQGSLDGTYIQSLSFGNQRGSFLNYTSPEDLLGHVIRLNETEYILLPNEGVKFFAKKAR